MTADTVGGVWTYSVELARALRSHNVEIALATMGRPLSSYQHQEAKKAQNLTVFESAFRLEWMDEPWEDTAKATAWLLKIRDRFDPDAVHLNGYVHGAAPWDLPVLVVGHSCVFSWWQAVHGELPPAHWTRYREEVIRGLRAATHVTAPSRTMMSNLETLYGPFASTSVVPNGRDPQDFRMGKKSPMILSAGRLWDPAKNVTALVEIADRLPWPLYLAGEDRFEQHGGDDLTKSGTQCNAIRLLGHLPSGELADWMARASIFVMPARYEPFGFTVLEAALSGCVLVLGDISSLRENWDGAAIFVSPDDRMQMKQVLEDLIRDPQQLQKLGLRAQLRAREFTSERMAGEYVKLYESLCNSYSSITH
jgi:glycosyltransferase involved in cell wall biosynthesis